MYRAWKHCCRIERRHIRRRQYPRRVSVVVPKLSLPSVHRNHFKIAADAEMFIEHLSKLANSHSMPSRKRKLPDKLRVFRFEDVPGDACAINRFRTITDKDFLS